MGIFIGANCRINEIDRIAQKALSKDPKSLFIDEESFDFDKAADEYDRKENAAYVDFDKMADEDDKTETKKVNTFDFDKMADEDDKTETKKVNTFISTKWPMKMTKLR